MGDPVPQPQLGRHCWVWNSWPPHGAPVAGVILGWHLQPKPYTGSPWMLQIVLQRAPGNIIVQWFPGHQVIPVRDPAPGERRKGVRHVWVRHESTVVQLEPSEGLLIDWRRGVEGWEAMVATAHGEGSMLAAWQPARLVVPVADDGWRPPDVDNRPKRSRRD